MAELSMQSNCSNCGGSGRILYVDPETGQYRDAGACQSCGGGGKTPDGRLLEFPTARPPRTVGTCIVKEATCVNTGSTLNKSTSWSTSRRPSRKPRTAGASRRATPAMASAPSSW